MSHVRTMSEVECTLNMHFPSRAVSLAVPNGHATSRHTDVWALIQEDAGGTKCFMGSREVCIIVFASRGARERLAGSHEVAGNFVPAVRCGNPPKKVCKQRLCTHKPTVRRPYYSF